VSVGGEPGKGDVGKAVHAGEFGGRQNPGVVETLHEQSPAWLTADDVGNDRQRKRQSPPDFHHTSHCYINNRKLLIQHKRTAAVSSKHSEARDRKEVTTRKDATLLAQLRSGHSILFQACWTNQPTPPGQDAALEAPHTLEHCLDCPGTVQARMEIFNQSVSLIATLWPESRIQMICSRIIDKNSKRNIQYAYMYIGAW